MTPSRRDTAFSIGKRDVPARSASEVGWMISTIILAIVLAAVFLSFVAIRVKRRRQYRQARERDPYLTRHDFFRRRKMSAIDRLEEEERQRSIMIHKSLASRSWGSLDSGGSQPPSTSRTISRVLEEDAIHAETPKNRRSAVMTPADDDGVLSKRLKDDWKTWEARMQRERQASVDQHPVREGTPTDLSPTIPQQAKVASLV